MNKKTHIFLLILAIIGTNFNSSLHAELLILKQTEAGFAPLDDSDAPHRKTIEDILLNYQWPMSSALALEPFRTRNELLETTGDLFTADKPNAEELFIEQEIQKQTGNSSYRVIFFPTTLYELFVIFETFNSYSQNNPLQKALYNVNSAKKIDLEPIFSEYGDPQIVRTLIKDSYEEFNNLFFDESTSAHDYINSTLVRKILSLYPDLETSADSLRFADSIKEKNEELLLTLLGNLAHLFKTTEIDTCLTAKFQTPYKKIEDLTQPEQQKIFKKIITLEYQARNLNKGLLLRGTSFEEFSPFTILEHPNTTLLAGLPVPLSQQTSQKKHYPMEKAYAQKTNTPYSISFGNSLLAGIFLDYGACTYNYLTQTKELPGAGYALFIDKRQYIDNNNGGLFFISPLSNLTALYAQGEYFHSRSKAATHMKKSSYSRGGIIGLVSRIEDPTGVLLITRDPLKHGALFSQFLAENGSIIQVAEDETERFEEDVLRAQQEAAKYLEAIQVLAPAIKKFEKKFRDEHPVE
jgi:hypothetical protein